MKNLCKALSVAAVAAVACGVLTAPKASADMLIQTTTMPSVVDYSVSDPVVLTQPAVIDTMPTTVITQPAVINSTPVIYDNSWSDNHLLHVGLPFLNFSLF